MNAPGFVQEDKHNRYLSDEELDAVLPSAGYSIVTPPPGMRLWLPQSISNTQYPASPNRPFLCDMCVLGVIGMSANPLDATGVWSHRDRLGVSPTPTSAGVASKRERRFFGAEASRAPFACLLGSSIGVVPGSYLDLTGHGVLSEPVITSISPSCLLFSSIPSSYVHSPTIRSYCDSVRSSSRRPSWDLQTPGGCLRVP